ncbi:MAG TPA: ion channel, partial [Catalimonadaceae bacterium]|nr:ion channel [Catalimonadaceae bacterium]
ARKGTPRIVSWIGWPFYGWMSVYCSFMIWFYSRTDLVKGEWSSLGKGRQLWLGILVGCYFLLFAVSGLAVRILNALALSLNVFVTLGYGEISASGTMRYLAVLEGLLGWFLLSIFSVSLIGQVLQ